jgi:hypothetical protein
VKYKKNAQKIESELKGERQKEKKEHSMSYNGTININFIGWRRFLAMGFYSSLSLSPFLSVSIQKNIIIFMLYSE